MTSDVRKQQSAAKKNVRLAKKLLNNALSRGDLFALEQLVLAYNFSLLRGDLVFLNRRWYVTHTGLLGLAHRSCCVGIDVEPVTTFCDPVNQRWAFRAVVYRSRSCRGFVGYGDADPSNVSAVVRGAEMRVAETRAVNRALRKAYGIVICSVEEIGSITALASPTEASPRIRNLPPESAKGNGSNGHGSNGSANGVRVRDRLCQVIRQHGLDAELVKAYAIDFCGTKALRDASREQVENFVVHLADWAAKDRNAVLCQLNSYSRPQAGAA
jgi:hypothetical protein